MSKLTVPNYKKEILKYSEMDAHLQKIVPEFTDFIDFINMYEGSDNEDLSMGRWKKLYACLSKINESLQSHYMIYENPSGVMFDISTHTMGTEEELIEVKESISIEESSVDRIKRYLREIEEFNQKIDYLIKRRDEHIEKVKELKSDFMLVLESMEKLGV